MVDFSKRILNSDKFRQAAIRFKSSGFYCSAPIGSTEYMNYWDEETERCLNGYTADDGDWISGYNYFYLNYCPILRIVHEEITDRFGVKKKIRKKVSEFPDFYDYDYYFFNAVQAAEDAGKHLAVLKSRRKGYEQPYSEDVLTPSGFRKMGELQSGDLVMNPGGQPTVILEVVEQGMRDVYEVEFQDGRTVRCGENHLWSTVNATRGKIHVMRTKDYAKRKLIQGSPGKEYYPYKIPPLNPLKFDSRQLEIDPYVLGVLLGDGCLSSSQILFSSDDEFIVEEMRARLPEYDIKKSKTAFQYVIVSKEKGVHRLGRKLKEYDLRVKSGDKFIPEIFKHSSVEDRFELVRGLMDTDGSCSKGAAVFTNTSERLIDDLIYVLRSLGIRCKKSREIEGRLNVDFNNGHFSDTKPHWELCITTEEDIFKLPRKLEKIRKDRQYNFNGIGIKAVRNLGYKENQRCIVVDHENSLYVTKDFIATHNSFKLGAMMDRNYYLIPSSKSFAFAAENEFLIKDGIITKAWEYMDFIDANTAWAKKRQKLDTKMHRRASVVMKDAHGNIVEEGYKSEVIGVTTKNDVNKIRGKCFGRNTKVLMHDGSIKNVQDIIAGDLVMGPDSNPRKVLETHSGFDNLYRIIPKVGDVQIVNSEHDIYYDLYQNANYRGESQRMLIKPEKYLKYGSGLMQRSGLIKTGVNFNNQPVPIDPYFIGIWLGDGSVGKTEITTIDSEIKKYVYDLSVELGCKFNSYSKKDNPLVENVYIHGGGVGVKKNKVTNILRDLGIYRDKRIPKLYLINSKEVRLSLLAGLIDTDGYYDQRYQRYEIIQKRKELAEDIVYLCRSLGMKTSINVKHIKGYGDYYRIGILSNAENIPVKIERKKYIERDKVTVNPLKTTFKVERHLYGEYFGFTVDKDHLFLLSDFTIVHNSGKLIVIEEGGKFPNLLELWQIARPSVEQDGIAHGLMIVFGTGGSDGDDFTGLKELFYHPDGYNCLALDNIWDEGGYGNKCGFFIPQYTNLDVRDDNGDRVYMDEDGNTKTDEARAYVLSLREDVIVNATDARSIDRYIAEQPCLDGDTMISTEDGISIIKDNPKAWCSGTKDIYRVEMNDGAELNLTMNHRLFDGSKYKELSEFNVGDELFYKPTIFSKEYQSITIPGLIKASDFNLAIDEQWGLFIGLFMGDGYYYGKSGELGIVFDKQDTESIDWAYSFMEKNFGTTKKKVTGKLGGGVVVRAVSKKMLDVVDALDLVRTRADGSRIRNVHVPYYIFNSPEPVVSNFLRGMFDSDGHAISSGSSVGFMSKYRQLSKDIQFLLRGFGIHSKWSHRIVINSSGYEYEENKISIRSNQIPLFRDGIGFLSKRKRDKIALYAPSRKGRDYSRDKIRSIEFYKRDKVYDITTTDSTLSASGIDVHNCTPAEACLELTGNIFPKKELSMQLSAIRLNKKLQNHKQVGDLIWVNGELTWQIKKHGDVTKYPLGKDDDTTGSIVIWEHPEKDPPVGLYIGGNDPYDFDKAATSTSLGSTIIYKRFQSFEGYYDLIVAEYTGRPSTANEYYENVLKLLQYYNARLLYENEKRGLFTYFANHHKDYLLADQPDIISDIIGRSTVQRRKGIHMTKEIIKYSEILIKDWLNEEFAPGHKNVERILSEPLLEELISYNDKGNFDRVRALQCVMIYREQLFTHTVKKAKEDVKRDLFEAPLFKRADEQSMFSGESKSLIKF